MNPKMRHALLVPMLLFCSAVFSAENSRPKGNNCDLVEPPAGAGDEMNHGVTLRIYPRAKEIGRKYSGCQTMWMPAGQKWSVISMVEIDAGDPVRVWSPEIPPPAGTECRYKKGRVVKGDQNHCPGANNLILKSLAPGCLEKVRNAISKGGLDAKRPEACDTYE